jgi:N-acetylglutamate synthase-like GNAT family acetyltransferase
MGVADCAYAEAAANRAALVTKPKSFVISCFHLICIKRHAVEMVAIIPMHPAARQEDLARRFLALCTS